MDDVITLSHGAGGAAYRRLVEEVFLPAYGSDELARMGDSAICDARGAKRVAFTTDGFVVSPLEFPGGDIGSLSISGTVNDLAVSGAFPRYISVSMVLEAGLSLETLRRICASIARTAKLAGVSVVTGDTKVVERAKADGMYITTSGIGTFDAGTPIPPQKLSPGDAIIVSGTIANHGMAVLQAREKLGFSPAIESDARPLNGIIRAALNTGADIHALRDPTRGGVGETLCEWAQGDIDISFEEEALPLRPGTDAALRLLGMDPLFVANEGIFLMAAPEKQAQTLVTALRGCPEGRDAAVIGTVTPGRGDVFARTLCGTARRIFLPRGELLPRIC